ncbi:hypothetical protein DD237_006621 [Peronospora effusa]|uniref:Uncharacterized protein n=1 Tax=Peronospora effusa TaxID=542832 RepID=A0A3R7W1G2_9STRA|nr:hypothetical protein DD237_006621 [Peronospora effusa]
MVTAARTHRTNALGVAARLSIYLSMRFVCLGGVRWLKLLEICSRDARQKAVSAVLTSVFFSQYVRINESAVQRCGYNNHKASEATSIACTAL